MEWFSQAVAVILLIASIISPIVTTLINNKHQLKLKKLEIFEIQKRNVLEEFIACSSKRMTGSFSPSQLSDFYNSLNKLYIYFSNIPETANSLISLSDEKFTNELTNIVVTLGKQIKKV